MAGELTIVASAVHLVRATDAQLWTAPAGEAGTAGQYFRQNTTTGYLEKGNASSTTEIGNFSGILLESVSVGETATIALPGAIIDLGAALDGAAPGSLIHLSDTDATLATSAGTSPKIVGTVIMAFGSTGGDRLLRLGSHGA